MIAYNFRAGGKGATSQAGAGQGKSAYTPATAYAPIRHSYRLAQARVGEQALIGHMCDSLGAAFPRSLITSYYVSLKTNPFVVLTGREGAGKAALATGFASVIVGAESAQFVTIGSNSWAQHSGESSYYRSVHERLGSLHFLETLQEAASPANLGKLYLVLLRGLTLDELSHYFRDLLQIDAAGVRRLALPGLAPEGRPVLPPNIFITATLHVPRSVTTSERELLRAAGQIAFDAGAHDLGPLPTLPPPHVGLQRIMLGSACHNPADARDRLAAILGARELRRLGPSAAIARRMPDSGAIIRQLADTIIAYVANSFDGEGHGLFDPDDARRNAQIAYDDQVMQRAYDQIAPPDQRLRRGRLGRLSPVIV
ncbi:hypothetical protein K2Z83_05495 [Oscillochloris sp. ZM17-4]|uniref:hypothetical protein n=1 Tax=Oscillochloris sp. ZM17-4 TaxID=2866714 RepID=UPI001C72D524|nr:hypothetical protein [Oscillochloris sp. ZM17-4]MBX0327134.1 hypothetical protein [Oscillochloris sp. ZM17-4]